MINPDELKLLRRGLEKLAAGYADLPEFTPQFDEAAVAATIDAVAHRMQVNFPPTITRSTPGRC